MAQLLLVLSLSSSMYPSKTKNPWEATSQLMHNTAFRQHYLTVPMLLFSSSPLWSLSWQPNKTEGIPLGATTLFMYIVTDIVTILSIIIAIVNCHLCCDFHLSLHSLFSLASSSTKDICFLIWTVIFWIQKASVGKLCVWNTGCFLTGPPHFQYRKEKRLLANRSCCSMKFFI